MTTPSLLPFSLALLLTAAAGAQDARPFERTGGTPLEVEITVLQIEGDGAVRPVAPEHRFAGGDLVAFELAASRGGYAHLAVADGDAEQGLRVLWPAATVGDPGSGHPLAADKPARLPPAEMPPLRLTGDGPTELIVLFSPRPPDEAPKRKWLKQIDLREIELAEAPVAGPRRLRYSGLVAAGETVKMRLVLSHGNRGTTDD